MEYLFRALSAGFAAQEEEATFNINQMINNIDTANLADLEKHIQSLVFAKQKQDMLKQICNSLLTQAEDTRGENEDKADLSCDANSSE